MLPEVASTQILAWTQHAALFGVPDQIGCHAVLDGAKRIEPFQLGVHLRVLERHDFVQANQRGRILLTREKTEDRIVYSNAMIVCHNGQIYQIPADAFHVVRCVPLARPDRVSRQHTELTASDTAGSNCLVRVLLVSFLGAPTSRVTQSAQSHARLA